MKTPRGQVSKYQCWQMGKTTFSYLSTLIVADGFQKRSNGRQRKGSALTGTRIAEGRTGNEAARANRRSTFLLKHFTKNFSGREKQRKKFEKGEAIP